MKSLWFLVPAHGREAMARTCLRQLARTCDDLQGMGVDAYVVVIANDGNLNTARELGFGTIERDNIPLGRKWNDGYQLAGRHGVDYVVPCGTDDWVTADYIADLPDQNEIRCSQRLGMVSEDGTRLSWLNVPYDGGHGIRVIPTGLLRDCGFRPSEEDRPRAIDTAVLRRIRRSHRDVLLGYSDLPVTVVDWKSPGVQLNSYQACQGYRDGNEADPFAALADVFPAAALSEMHSVYQPVMEVAA